MTAFNENLGSAERHASAARGFPSVGCTRLLGMFKSPHCEFGGFESSRRVALKRVLSSALLGSGCSFPRHGTPQSFVPRNVMTFLVPGTRTKDAQAVMRWQETNLDKWPNLEVIVTKVIDQVSTPENLPSRRHVE